MYLSLALTGDCSENCGAIHPSELSNQLIELENRLKEEGAKKSLRAIIFVETKTAAVKLVQRLKSQFPQLNPVYVTGHSSGIGTSVQDQKKVISNFRAGKNSILLLRYDFIFVSILEAMMDFILLYNHIYFLHVPDVR